jgi:hypothetical protein
MIGRGAYANFIAYATQVGLGDLPKRSPPK